MWWAHTVRRHVIWCARTVRRHVIWWVRTDVSVERAASNFSARDLVFRREIGQQFLLYFGTYLTNYTA